ncbi:MAG: hypothetical protein WB818_11370 [Desulfobacterales bacterium]
MDSPPHILKPLRTILLETASGEKIDPHLQVFYQESSERRFRPLSSNFRELKILDFVAALMIVFYRPAQ